ncbi:Hypothetical predicted protein [Mytilus galloprovincialis]|uniref:Tetratricopeptide repeat protein n=1 Tax=Mytilus galloprovincialis TaxID=29158 RepID=A0A8B6C081_MYTGA|nr:Hypothetical predicted protein [Mytilus galloprovincialis]
MEAYIKDVECIMKNNLLRTHDSHRMYHTKSGPAFFEYSMFTDFPDSPTAKRYIKAFELFCVAEEVLRQCTITKVETVEDCEYLQSAFHGYAKANLCEGHLFDTFRPTPKTIDLIDQYLKLRPNDILTEYFKTAIIHKEQPSVYKSQSGYSSGKHLKKLIKMNEQFALKVSKKKHQSEIQRDILIDIFFLLGSLYSITDQEVRALDSFQKSYDLDNSNLDSLYGVAFYNFYRKFDKAESLLKKYLELAPECDKRYYDAYYTLGLIHLKRDNINQATECYYKGVAAEKKQLPCLPAWDTYSRMKARLYIPH